MLEQMCEFLSVKKASYISRWNEFWPQYEIGEFDNVVDYINFVSNGSYDASGLNAALSLHNHYERNILIPRASAQKLLKQLRISGYRIGVVTNCAMETPHFWQEMPLADLVDCAVFSSLEKIRKPNPNLIKLCIERLQSSPPECLFIGDGANDELNAARTIGVTPVLLNNSNSSSVKYLESWEGLVVNDLAEIELMLENIKTQSQITQECLPLKEKYK